MKKETRWQLAQYLQSKLHAHLPGFYFSAEDVLEHIDEFFKVIDLIEQRDTLQKQIDELTK